MSPRIVVGEDFCQRMIFYKRVFFTDRPRLTNQKVTFSSLDNKRTGRMGKDKLKKKVASVMSVRLRFVEALA
jgi:hypothetical protein